MRRAVRGLLSAAAFLSVAVPARAQELTWEASVRPRAEGRDLGGETEAFYTSMRTRLALRARLSADVRLFVQLQDTRFWGGRSLTFDGSADAFDLHQGWFELGHRGESVLWTRVGRQEMEFGNGRLIGAPEWSQVGRAFDGVRAAVRLGEHTVLDAFGSELRESFVAFEESDATLWGLWGRRELPGYGEVSLFWIHDRDGNDPETMRSTLGLYHVGRVGPATFRLEGAWQGGDVQGLDLHNAYMVAASLGAPLLEGRGDLEVGYDRYSGSADPEAGRTEAFDDPYGRNHRFFGFADLFVNIPVQTAGRGIQDLRGRAGWGLPRNGRLRVDLHHFRVADAEGLDSGTLANEVDLTVSWRGLMEGWLGVQGGASFADIAGAGDVLLDRFSDQVWFGYAMVEVAF